MGRELGGLGSGAEKRAGEREVVGPRAGVGAEGAELGGGKFKQLRTPGRWRSASAGFACSGSTSVAHDSVIVAPSLRKRLAGRKDLCKDSKNSVRQQRSGTAWES